MFDINPFTGQFDDKGLGTATLDLRYLKLTGSLAEVSNHSHTVLTDIGTNTHAQIDTFIGTTVPATYLPLAGGTMTGGITNSTSINPLTTLAESWIGPSTTTGIYFKAGNVGIGTTSPSQLLTLSSTGVLGWDNGSGAADIQLSRIGNGILQFDNGTHDEEIRLYSKYTDASNNAYLSIKTQSSDGQIFIRGVRVGNSFSPAVSLTAWADLYIGGSNTGTWRFWTDGAFSPNGSLAVADNTYDLGRTYGRIKTLYVGTSVLNARQEATNAAGDSLTVQAGGSTDNMVSTVSITAGGTGYSVNDVLTLATPTGGVAATVTVTTVSSGVVTGVSLTTKGSKYTTGTKTTTVAPAGGTGCTINVTARESATDKAGGDLILKPGVSSGTGESGVQIQGCVAGASGATDNSLVNGIQVLGNKIGLFNVTPVVRPTTSDAAATFTANTSGIVDDTATFDGFTIGQVVKALRNLGILT